MTTALQVIPEVIVEIPELEVYCPRCCNGRIQIRPGGSSCFDTVPCQHCRPAAHEAALAPENPDLLL